MIRSDEQITNASRARSATNTPSDVELARRLNILTDPEFEADCSSSSAPMVKKLLLWGAAAAAAWLLMIWRLQ